MIPIKTSSVRGLAKSAGKPVGGGGCAGAGAGACAKSAFKAFKCIVEMWPDTLGKLTGLASVIGHLPVRVVLLDGIPGAPASGPAHCGQFIVSRRIENRRSWLAVLHRSAGVPPAKANKFTGQGACAVKPAAPDGVDARFTFSRQSSCACR